MIQTPFSWLAQRYSLPPRVLRWATTATLVFSILIVLGGGIVRVTGSGLGCPTWPACDTTSLAPSPAMGIHAFIEFTNRLLSAALCITVASVIIAARLQAPRVRAITRLAWSQFWLVVVNAIVGGISVYTDLNPYVVAFHFLAAMALLTTTTLTWHRVHETAISPKAPSRISASARRLSWALMALTTVLVIVGTLVSGSGPHSGDSIGTPRMAIDWTIITVAHGVLGALTLVVAIMLGLVLRRTEAMLPLRRVLAFVVIVVVQAIIGIVQALTHLPAVLVAAHLLIAALVWVGALRVLLDVNPRLFPTVHTETGRLE